MVKFEGIEGDSAEVQLQTIYSFLLMPAIPLGLLSSLSDPLHQLEVLIYGIFTVLFALSIYIFRYRFTPRKLYIVATFLFFILGTASVVLDIAFRCLALPLLNAGSGDSNDQPISSVTGSALLDLQTAPGNISFVASLLSDLLLMHQCYRLYNSRTLVILIPAINMLISNVTWIVVGVRKQRDRHNLALGIELSEPIGSVYNTYIIMMFAQNLTLTVMIAGRLWWLDRKMSKISISHSDHSTVNPGLINLILESGVIIPSHLLLWLVLNNTPGTNVVSWIGFGMLTQVTGISSVLIFIRIGIRKNVLAAPTQLTSLDTDIERQAQSSDSLPEDCSSIRPTMSMNPETIQPFVLKYEPHLRRMDMQGSNLPETDLMRPLGLEHSNASPIQPLERVACSSQS